MLAHCFPPPPPSHVASSLSQVINGLVSPVDRVAGQVRDFGELVAGALGDASPGSAAHTFLTTLLADVKGQVCMCGDVVCVRVRVCECVHAAVACCAAPYPAAVFRLQIVVLNLVMKGMVVLAYDPPGQGWCVGVLVYTIVL